MKHVLAQDEELVQPAADKAGNSSTPQKLMSHYHHHLQENHIDITVRHAMVAEQCNALHAETVATEQANKCVILVLD
ncbi:MAG: hypothetical protein IJR39_14075 [Treponema sp.]|nr:hypothetical protein [Treponema sp.]